MAPTQRGRRPENAPDDAEGAQLLKPVKGKVRLTEVDTRTLLTHLATLVAKKEVVTLTEHLHDLIAYRPASMLLDLLDSEQILKEGIKSLLTPHAMGIMSEYAKALEPQAADFGNYLNSNEQFYLSLLFARDRAMAEHSMDVVIETYRAFEKIPAFQKAAQDMDQKAVAVRAAALHDLGKMEAMPDFVLNSPLTRPEQRAVYVEYLQEQNRSQAKLPEALKVDDELQERWEILLQSPGQLDETTRRQLAEEILKTCEAQNVDDVRDALPTLYLLQASRRMLQEGKASERTMRRLAEQRDHLAELETITAAYGLSPEETFRTTLGGHERRSQTLLKRANGFRPDRRHEAKLQDSSASQLSRTLYIVGQHHGYADSLEELKRAPLTSSIGPREEDQGIIDGNRILDLEVALTPLSPSGSNERSYSEPKLWAVNRNILREKIADGHLNPKITDDVIREFIQPRMKAEARKARLEGGEIQKKLFGIVFENLKRQSVRLTKEDLEKLEFGSRTSGEISVEHSSAILSLVEAFRDITQSSKRAQYLRLYFEENLELVPLMFEKILHNKKDEFVSLLENAEREARVTAFERAKEQKSGRVEARKEFEERQLESVRERFFPVLSYLHDELRNNDFVKKMGESGVVEIDAEGFPIARKEEFDARYVEMGIDSIMDGVEIFAEIKDERYLEEFRAYLKQNPTTVFAILSSAKNMNGKNFELYMQRVERAILKKTRESDLQKAVLDEEENPGKRATGT